MCALVLFLMSSGCDPVAIGAGALIGANRGGGSGGPPGQLRPPTGYIVRVVLVDARTLDCTLTRTIDEALIGLSFEVLFPASVLGLAVSSASPPATATLLVGGHVAVGVDQVDSRRVKVAGGRAGNTSEVRGIGDILTFRLTSTFDLPDAFLPTVENSRAFRLSLVGDFAEQVTSTLQWSVVKGT